MAGVLRPKSHTHRRRSHVDPAWAGAFLCPGLTCHCQRREEALWPGAGGQPQTGEAQRPGQDTGSGCGCGCWGRAWGDLTSHEEWGFGRHVESSQEEGGCWVSCGVRESGFPVSLTEKMMGLLFGVRSFTERSGVRQGIHEVLEVLHLGRP